MCGMQKGIIQMPDTMLLPWRPDGPVTTVPASAKDASSIAPLARQLRPSDIQKVIKAFDSGLYDLAVEYVWTRTMAVLKRQLGLMGMAFVGEMLARPDIKEDSVIELVVTDSEAIQLAHSLGIIDQGGALKLRHATELLTYNSSPDSQESDELSFPEALGLLRNCVIYILARENIEAALNFAEFRNRLTQSVLSSDDRDVISLLAAPYFFKRTTLRVLLAEAKTGKGAKVESALGNLSTLLPLMWATIQDPDRWQVGQAFAEANSENNKLVSATLRRTLMKVKGFDFVPESLRSGTYSRAAADVLTAHEGMDNYFNEVAPMKTLASLGNVIPGPAIQICMRATLAVSLGNRWGYSFGAEQHADSLLRSLGADRWQVYLSRFLASDEIVLSKLTEEKPTARWCKLVNRYDIDANTVGNGEVAALIKAAKKNVTKTVQSIAVSLLAKQSL